MVQQVIIRCHCGQLTEKVELRDEIASNGIRGALCHCNICRHVTGAMTFSGIALASAPADVFMKKLVEYPTSKHITRYFCSTCGSHVCYRVVVEDRWCVCSGAIDEIVGDKQEKLEDYFEHEFVADTGDGGLAWLVPDVPAFAADDGQTPMTDWKSELRKLQQGTINQPYEKDLWAECHCGKWRVSIEPADEGKYIACICTCRSCRLSFSQPMVAWALNIPYKKVKWEEGSTYNGEVREPLVRFQSSDHAHRDFCSKCGASISYDSAKDGNGVMDIAFGVLRPTDGALAKSFFTWDTSKIHHFEDVIDKRMLSVFKDNLMNLEQV